MRVLLIPILVFLMLSQLALADVTTDKDVYKPTELVITELSHSAELGDITYLVTNYKGDPVVSVRGMKEIGPNKWGYNFTLPRNSLNGDYTISINASEVGAIVNATNPIMNFRGSFEVNAWKIESSLNRYSFSPGEKIDLSVIISDKYTDGLSFKVSYEIRDPKGDYVTGRNFTLTGVSKGFVDFYTIPGDYPFGMSKVNLRITDSDNREYQKNISFEVSEPFIIEPGLIEEMVKDDELNRKISLENKRTSTLNIESVEISPGLVGIVSIVQRPYLINPGESSVLELSIDPASMKEDAYGSVILKSGGKEYVIPIELSLIKEDEGSMFDNVMIIWFFAIVVVVAIVIITIIRYRKLRKQREKEKKAEKEEKDRKFFVEPKDQYRTEYY